MIEIDIQTLSDCYKRRMDWFPAVNNPQEVPQYISGIAEIMDQFELIMLDSYGVLCRGLTPIAGAVEAMTTLRQAGKKFCVVSNDTMTNRRVAVEKYAERGFDFLDGEIVTSLDITENWLKSLESPEEWAYIAPLTHPSNELLTGMTNLNALHGVIPEGIKGILFLASTTWNTQWQTNLEQSARGRQFNLVIGNPDMGAPVASGETIGLYATPGYFADRLVTATHQVATPLLLGKPGAAIFREVAKQYGVTDPAKVLMVGDTLYTDILGGNAMGFKTLLLECGVYQGSVIEEVIADAGIVPDFIAPQLG